MPIFQRTEHSPHHLPAPTRLHGTARTAPASLADEYKLLIKAFVGAMTIAVPIALAVIICIALIVS
jgi:hypothetical protein